MYCDICEMFDLHDTDDCPRQAMDSPPPRQTHNLPRGFERPYCDACESKAWYYLLIDQETVGT